jgi:CRP/FNR family transcriptional regulator
VVPIVKDGLIKVFTRYEDRELFLYHIQPGESCIMSFAACMRRGVSQVHAVTEVDTECWLLPADHLPTWLATDPDGYARFLELYNKRYTELLDTIHGLLFKRLDERILTHIRQKSTTLAQNPLVMSHRQIADEVGTSREVVTRILQKLQADGDVSLQDHGIFVRFPVT